VDTDADAKFFKGSSHQPTIDEFETCFQNLRHSTTCTFCKFCHFYEVVITAERTL